MSLIHFSSGNFHQLSRNLGNRCFQLIQFHTKSTCVVSGDSKRLSCRFLRTSLDGRLHKPKSIGPRIISTALLHGNIGSARTVDVTEESNHHKVHDNHYNSLLTILENRVFGWPYVFIVFDLETTGYSANYEKIVEIAARDLSGGKNSTFESFVNPDKCIKNTNIHNITTCMVNNPETPRFEEVIPLFLQFIRSRQMDGKRVALIAHYARFDVSFLVEEFHRCSVEIPSDWVFIDTLPLAKQLVMPDGSKLPTVKLPDLKKHYNISVDGEAHRAMHDVNVLCEVLQRITFDLKMPVSELSKLARAFPIYKVKTT